MTVQAFDLQVVELTARLLIGGVFLVAGLVKLTNPAALRRDISSYKLLPTPVAQTIGVLLPPFEAILGIALIVGVVTALTAFTVAVLCMIFLIASASAMIRRLNINCGCFGMLYREPVGRQVIVRDSILLALSLYVLQFQSDRLGGNRLLDPSGVADLLTLIMVTLVVLLGAGAGLIAMRRRILVRSNLPQTLPD
jgi:uncharacterized membrane protein YphA (DoxX/SURF4 family)